MESLWQWGLDCIRLVQTLASPPLTACMLAITSLGTFAAYLVLIPLVYWCIDEKNGLRLGIVMLISAWSNLALKFLLDQPRPFFEGYDPSVGMVAERFAGFPSGHAQNSLVLWIIIASWGKKPLYFVLASLFCLLIAFTRIYLGVHFPTDILGGWLLGGLILCIYFVAGKRIEALLASGGNRAGTIACAAISFAMILYRPSVEVLVPAGLLLGMGTGFFMCRRYIGFTASLFFGRTSTSKYLMMAARFALGIAGVVLLFKATESIDALFSSSGNYHLFFFLRFALLAFWVSAGAPLLFRLLRLAESDMPPDQGSA
jgi:membrane-associated phospholipid phosphatase